MEKMMIMTLRQIALIVTAASTNFVEAALSALALASIQLTVKRFRHRRVVLRTRQVVKTVLGQLLAGDLLIAISQVVRAGSMKAMPRRARQI
jgi:hypothetical protein